MWSSSSGMTLSMSFYNFVFTCLTEYMLMGKQSSLSQFAVAHFKLCDMHVASSNSLDLVIFLLNNKYLLDFLSHFINIFDIFRYDFFSVIVYFNDVGWSNISPNPPTQLPKVNIVRAY